MYVTCNLLLLKSNITWKAKKGYLQDTLSFRINDRARIRHPDLPRTRRAECNELSERVTGRNIKQLELLAPVNGFAIVIATFLLSHRYDLYGTALQREVNGSFLARATRSYDYENYIQCMLDVLMLPHLHSTDSIIVISTYQFPLNR